MNAKMIDITTIGIRNNGFTMDVTIIAPPIFNKTWVASRKAFGKNSSAAPISLENRFKIRPDGFVSKNRIVVDMMPANIVSCSFCDARTVIV